MLPAGILISLAGIVYPSPVHPRNLYPSLSARTGRVNAPLSIVYEIGERVSVSSHVKLTVYESNVQFAVTTTSPVLSAAIPAGVHPTKLYPDLESGKNSNSSQ